MANNSLWKRTISGLILVVLTVEMTVINSWTFYIFWSIVALLCLGEFYALLRKHGWKLWGLVKKGEKATGSVIRKRIGYYTIGTAYILGAFLLTLLLGYRTENYEYFVITLLTLIWATDTGAFLVGITIGKHKMAPKISPKKSWEGFCGGLLFSVAVALLWYALFWQYAYETMAFFMDSPLLAKAKWFGLGLVVALACTAGDLVESVFKRKLEIKDSGNIIPGHGGVLDRFDAFLMAAPVAWIYIMATGLV